MSGQGTSILSSDVFAGRRFAVLGLARSGLATVRALVASGASVLAWDRDEDARAAAARYGDRVEIGPLDVESLQSCEAVVVSPGVPLNRHPIADTAKAAGKPVIGDMELFAIGRGGLPSHKVVGITGTNGKSTTAALVHHLLQTANVPTLLGGNIGIPVLSADPLPSGGVYVLELSSFQIDLTRSLACDVAILLNITPDHLDRYDDGFEGYAKSKARLFSMQDIRALALVDRQSAHDNAAVRNALIGRAPVMIEDVDLPGDPSEWPALQGAHNHCNAGAAVAAARRLGLADADIARGLQTFPGLPHRMQRVAEVDGVLYVNDSKATNPASAAPALAAFASDTGTPRVHWIVGGLAKGEDLGECEGCLDQIAAAYTIGEAGEMFARLLEGHVPVTRAELLAEAVRSAAARAGPGDVVLLSPACASYDQFRDFEKRGEAFVQMVEALKTDSEERKEHSR